MVIILCYHKISNITNDYNMVNVTPEHFRHQMEYLSSKYTMVSLEALSPEHYESDTCMFAVTFDDGYRDILYRALPVLEAFSIPATAFITTGNLDTPYENWTDTIIRAIFEPADKKDYFECMDEELRGYWYTRTIEEKASFYRKINYLFRHIGAQRRKKYEKMLLKWAQLSPEGRRENQILSTQELKKLSQSPLITIGGHSVTHPSLGALTREEQEFEISECVRVLKGITGLDIKYMAYPFGARSSYNAVTMELLKRYGIEMAFTTLNERITKETDPFQMPRVAMGNYGLEDFKQKIDNIISNQKLAQNQAVGQKKAADAVYYVGSIEHDTELLDRTKNIVIWGCGFWGQSLYHDLQLLNLCARVIAFGDNASDKVGRRIEGIPVLGKADVLKIQDEKELIILIKNAKDLELFEDLKKSGFREIHLIVRT